MRRNATPRVLPAFRALAALALLSLRAPGAGEPAGLDRGPTLFQARAALADGLAPLAERLTAELLDSGKLAPPEWVEALDLHGAAILQQGKPGLLLQRLDALASVAPGAPAAAQGLPALWRARALLALERPTEATEELRKALPDATGPIGARLRLELPSACLAAGDTNAALAAFQELREIPLAIPERAGARLEEARLLRRLSRAEEAEKCLETLLEGAAEEGGEALDRTRWQLAEWRLEREAYAAALPLLARLAGTGTAPDVRTLALLGLSRIAEGTNDLAAATASAEAAVAAAQSLPAQWMARAGLTRLLLRSGTLERAREALRQTLELQPGHPDATRLQLEYADVLLRHEQPAAALPEYQAVLEGATDPALEAQAQRGRAECLVAIGRLAEAAVAFLRVAELAGDAAQREAFSFRAAELLRDAGLHAQAAESLARFQASFPESPLAPRAALLQGECLAAVAPAEAEAHYLALARRFPETPEAARALFQAAQLAAARDAPTLAIERYEEVNRHPRADPALQGSSQVGAGLIHLHRFHFDRALQDFEQATAREGPAGEQARYLRAVALYNLGREEDAIEACRRFLEELPESPWAPDATYWMGRYHFNRQQFEEAERYFLRFVETWPTRPECDGALLWVARARFALKRWPEASAVALQLIRDFPESPLLAAARLVHGESLCERMRFDEAILAFDELLALHPESPWAVQALGRKGDSLFTLGTDDVARYRESIAVYQALLARPKLPLDMQLQAAYKIGRCHEKAGQIEPALEQYYRGVILRYAEARDNGVWPNERARAWFARAALSASDLYEQREQWTTAVAILQRMADENVPGHADAAERARRILREHPAAARP